MKADLSLYSDFVDGVTSPISKNQNLWVARMEELTQAGINPTQFNTAAIGLAGESGEFAELNKKINWHGKEVTDEVRAHLEKELGDIIFYWMMACRSLSLDPDQVIAKNVAKLEARYPGGVFSVERSENRAQDDV